MENGTDSEFNTYPLLQEISDLLQTTLGKQNCFLKNLALLENGEKNHKKVWTLLWEKSEPINQLIDQLTN